MQELEPTWARLASVWWLLLWRGILGGVIVGIVAGGIAGGIAGAVLGRVDVPLFQAIGRVAGLVAGVPWGFVVLRMMFKKKYRMFRIVLVPRHTDASVFD